MKTLLRIVGVLVVLVVAFFLFGFLLPREVSVERTTTIDLPPAQVYPLVVDLKRWPDWQAWNKEMDPTVTYNFSDPTVGEGAWYEWTGEKLSTGKVELKKAVPDSTVDFTVDFAGSGPNPGSMQLDAADAGKTTATWSFKMDMGFNPIGRYCGLFLEGMVAADFDKGLANLKRVAETEKPEPLEADTAPVAEPDASAPDVAVPDVATEAPSPETAPDEAATGESVEGTEGATPPADESAADSGESEATAAPPEASETAAP